MKVTGFLALTIGFASTLLGQADYEIRFNRPFKSGDRYNAVVTGTNAQEMQIRASGEILQTSKDEFSVEYGATRKVLEVEAAGRPTKVADTIKKLVLIRGNNRTDLAKAGAELVASIEDNKKKFEMDGRIVDSQTAKALEVVIDITRGGVTDDEIFGTKKRKKPGETWAMNSVVAANDLAKRANVELRNLVGNVKLESLAHETVGDVLNLTCHMTGDTRLPTPAHLTSIQGPLKATFSCKLPADLSLVRPEESLVMQIVFEGSGQMPNGTPITVTGSMERSIASKVTPVK